MPGFGRSDIAKQDALRSQQTAAQASRSPDATLADVVAALGDVVTAIEGLQLSNETKLDAIAALLTSANTKLDTIAGHVARIP